MYSCHGSWADEVGTVYLLASQIGRPSNSGPRMCFIHEKIEGTLRISAFSETCERGGDLQSTSHVAFNVTKPSKFKYKLKC